MKSVKALDYLNNSMYYEGRKVRMRGNGMSGLNAFAEKLLMLEGKDLDNGGDITIRS